MRFYKSIKTVIVYIMCKSKDVRFFRGPLLCAVFVFCCIACSGKNFAARGKTLPSQTRPVLGTVCTIQLFENGRQKYYDALFERLSEIEAHMSVNIPSSDIVRVNAAAGLEAVEVHEDTFKVVKTALAFAALTDGAFNPAGGALVQLWNIGGDAPHLPSQKEIDNALSYCDWRTVVLEDAQKTDGAQNGTRSKKPSIFLTKKGTALDLGGIAKGYAADELANILRSFHITSAIIDLGGNIYAVGKKTGGVHWRVGIKNPFDSTGAPALAIALKDTSVVTSGVYERFFEKDGKRYHHLLDYTTGMPADNGLMSVTIINRSSMNADALATAVFVMGKEKGLKFLHEHNIDGLCIDNNGVIGVSATLQGGIEILDSTFKIE